MEANKSDLSIDQALDLFYHILQLVIRHLLDLELRAGNADELASLGVCFGTLLLLRSLLERILRCDFHDAFLAQTDDELQGLDLLLLGLDLLTVFLEHAV